MDLELANAPAVITGASSGLGYSIARHLAAEGVAVGLIARAKAQLQSAADRLRSEFNARVAFAVSDVTDSRALTQAVNRVAEELGGIRLVVANAGGSVGGDFLDSREEDLSHTLALNVGHAATLIRAAYPHMAHQKDNSAVIVSSITGVKPGPRYSYAAAKAAEIHMAATLALELAADDIRVNSVSPGSFIADENTGWGLFRQKHPADFARFVEEDFPLGRLGNVDEIADVVAFLLSRRASWINGTNVAVDGAQRNPTARRFNHRRLNGAC